MVDLNEKTRLCSVCFKMCRDVCSVAGATRREADSPHNRAFFAELILEGKEGLTPEIVDYFYRCSMCKACREACETGMDVSEIMLNARRELDSGLLPERVKEAKEKVISGDYYSGDSPEVKKMISQQKNIKNKDILFYFGRRTRATKGDTIRSTLSVMEKLGVDFGIMEDEPSSGQIAYFLGFTDDARKLGELFSQKIRELRPKKLVFFSSCDLRMILKEYPNLGIELKGLDIVSLPEFLLSLLKEKKASFGKWSDGIVTYHDPCSLGRELRIFEAPRKIVKLVVKSEFKEMALTKDQAPCCGWGMGLEISHPDLSKLMAMRLQSMAEEVGAKVMVTGCSTCRDVIIQNQNKKVSKTNTIEILDLPMFIERAFR
jgi:Fe-S oxidoreductase